MVDRERKKLPKNTNWYRDKLNNSDENIERDMFIIKRTDGTWSNYRRCNKGKKMKGTMDINNKKEKGEEKKKCLVCTSHEV